MPLFADLEPPPHGLVKLRARMARRRKRAAWIAGLVLGPAAATAALVAVVAPSVTTGGDARERVRFDHPALVDVREVAGTSSGGGVHVVVDGARIPAVQVSDGAWIVP